MLSFYNIHDSAKPFPTTLRPYFDVWLSGQEMLPEVVRWKTYREKRGTRRQDDLQHTFSLAVLAFNFADRLQAYIKLDWLLVVRSAKVHEVGEGETHRDVEFNDKTDKKDLEEFLAFEDRFHDLPNFYQWRAAFLLQFAAKCPAVFPLYARKIMNRLAKEKPYEILAFQALEHYDYLLYAIEQRLRLGEKDCLAQVFMNSRPVLDSLAEKLPGFKQEFWTPELIAWCEEMAEGGSTELPK